VKILAVDVGNSEIKRAHIKDGVIGQVKRDPAGEIDRIANEIASGELPVTLSSVREHATSKIKAALKRKQKELILEVDHQIDNPVSGFYSGMGADRIADISAAWTKHEGKPVLVVGLGTATTCTAASSSGLFKGGFITLGLGATCASLTVSLPELPPIDPRQARSLEPGFDPYSSLCRGTVSAHVAIVEEWVTLFRRQIGSDLVVVATGGWSELLAPHCCSIHEVDPYLTLRGIWTITNASGWTTFA
jgi:type III pantothenate kinase